MGADEELDESAAAAAAAAMTARILAVVAQGDDVDIATAHEILIEGIAMLPADEAWKAAEGITYNAALRLRATTIAAEKGSPDAAFAMYEAAGDMTAQLRWLVRADALGHEQARVIADGLRAEGLLAPRNAG